MSASTNAGAWFATLGIHTAVFAGTSLIFGYLRRHKLFRRFYAAKRYSNTNRRKPTKLPQGFFAWMGPLMAYNDNDIAEIAGIDALTYLRLQWFGVELFAFISLLGLVVIIPTNYAGGAIRDSDLSPPGALLAPPPPPPPPHPPAPMSPGMTCSYDTPIPEVRPTGNLDRITMSNVPQGSNLLWVHLCVCVAIVFYTLRLLWRYNRMCVVARLAYLGSVEPGAEANTVLVQDIPGLRTGSFLDAALRVVQGPLRIVTPKNVNEKLEANIANTFGAGSGLKIPRTKEARLRWAAEDFGSGSMAPSSSLEAELEIPESLSTLSSRDGGNQEFFTPRGSATVSEASTADLPQVIVQLDGKVLHHDDTPSQDACGVDDADTDSAPSDNGEHESIADLKTLEKELMAWPAAQRYLNNHSVEELVLKYFQSIYGDDVACVNIIPSQSALFPVINSYNSTSQSLEDLMNEYSFAMKRKLKIKVKVLTVFPQMYGSWGTSRFGSKSVKVEAIAFYMARLEEINNRIREGQAEADVTAEPTAFVTFRSRVAQTIASTALQDHDTGAWTVAPAPGPDEIIWTNLGMRAWLRGIRSLVVNAAYICIILFYGLPVTALQTWLTTFILSLPITPEIFKSLVPGLVLKALLATLPMVLGFLAVVRGAKSQAEVQWEMTERYFPFQVIVVFIFQLFGQLASNLIELSNIIIAQPTKIFELVAAYAPLQSWFFTSYVLVLGLSSRAIQFLNPVPLALFWLKSSTAVTASAKARVLNSIFFQYGAMIPLDTMNLLFGLVFAVQNPMLPFVVLISFLTGNFVFRYNLMYVYSERFQGGGAVWPTIVNQILTGVIIFEIFMVGMFSLYKAPFCSLIMVIVFLITMAFWRGLVMAFNRPQKVMSMTAAASMDEKNGVLDIAAQTLQRVYKPPVMRDNDAIHDELMENAQQILDKISADPAYQELTALKDIPEPEPSASGGSQSSRSTPVRGNTEAYIPPNLTSTAGKRPVAEDIPQTSSCEEPSSATVSGGIFSKNHPDEGPSAHPIPASPFAAAAAASGDGENKGKKAE